MVRVVSYKTVENYFVTEPFIGCIIKYRNIASQRSTNERLALLRVAASPVSTVSIRCKKRKTVRLNGDVQCLSSIPFHLQGTAADLILTWILRRDDNRRLNGRGNEWASLPGCGPCDQTSSSAGQDVNVLLHSGWLAYFSHAHFG